jgi:hypothetical protein
MFGDELDKEVPLRQHSNLSSSLLHHLRADFARLRNEGWSVLQPRVAASAAWYLATLLLENPRLCLASATYLISALPSLGHGFRG